MPDRKSDPSPDSRKSETIDSTGKPERQADGQHLSASDHMILEDAIRRSISKAVEAGHSPSSAPTLTASQSGEIGGGVDAADSDAAEAFRPRLMRAISDPDPRHHRRLTEEIVKSGLPTQTLAMHLFTPVAAELGRAWCDDTTDFVQVAVAATRLNMMLHSLAQDVMQSGTSVESNKHMILARAPEAMHTIGIAIVAACFRDRGWIVDGGSDLVVEEPLFRRIDTQPYTLVGLSAGSLLERDLFARTIERIRRDHGRDGMLISIGGPAVAKHRSAFEDIGADIVAVSAVDAVEQAELLCR